MAPCHLRSPALLHDGRAGAREDSAARLPGADANTRAEELSAVARSLRSHLPSVLRERDHTVILAWYVA